MLGQQGQAPFVGEGPGILARRIQNVSSWAFGSGRASDEEGPSWFTVQRYATIRDLSGRSAARLARLLWEQEVGSSNLPAPTM